MQLKLLYMILYAQMNVYNVIVRVSRRRKRTVNSIAIRTLKHHELLPDDIITCIFTFLSAKDVVLCCKLCLQWYHCANEASYWNVALANISKHGILQMQPNRASTEKLVRIYNQVFSNNIAKRLFVEAYLNTCCRPTGKQKISSQSFKYLPMN